uniref:Uncharacterized protein n=1 Tax=Nelumbo nucifera TaxID=4432 RepID=A0A822Y5A1_NELNU|nr:TPA_asm: hypothetical protein HUJ06_030592 [Nelumbo nucifera]
MTGGCHPDFLPQKGFIYGGEQQGAAADFLHFVISSNKEQQEQWQPIILHKFSQNYSFCFQSNTSTLLREHREQCHCSVSPFHLSTYFPLILILILILPHTLAFILLIYSFYCFLTFSIFRIIFVFPHPCPKSSFGVQTCSSTELAPTSEVRGVSFSWFSVSLRKKMKKKENGRNCLSTCRGIREEDQGF